MLSFDPIASVGSAPVEISGLEIVAAEQNFDTTERRRLDQLAHQVREALEQRWAPS